MKRLVLFLFATHYVHSALALTYNIESLQGSTLRIVGIKAQVELQRSNQRQTTVQVEGAEEAQLIGLANDNLWQMKTTKTNQGTTLQFSAKNREKIAGMPKLQIVISGIAVPVEVFLTNGQIRASKWNQNLSVTLTEGSVAAAETEGRLKLSVHKGSFSVRQHEGPINVDSYNTNGALQNVRGNIEVSNFLGQTKIEDVEGSCFVRSYKGVIDVVRGKGSFEFDNGNGTLNAQKFQGRIVGTEQDGNAHLVLSPDEDVKIDAGAGRVSLQVDNNSGANVNLGSKEGRIQYGHQQQLKLTQYPQLKVVTGKLMGATAGRIHVRTKDGPIIFR